MLHYTLVGTDNQASLLALNNQKPHPAHYLIDHIHDTAEKLHAKQSYLCAPTITQAPTCKVIDLHLHWTLGHMDFPPNERADNLAKSAAQGSSSAPNLLPKFLQSKPLPFSISALRQENMTSIQKDWKRRWKASPCFPLIRSIDKLLPANAFLKLIDPLDRRQSAIIAQLHTGHSPLNHHLFRIRRSETPSCPHCLGITVETVSHYLFQCPHYQNEWHYLRCKLKRKADSLSFLLSNPIATKPLLKYIHTTKWFSTQARSARRPPNPIID